MLTAILLAFVIHLACGVVGCALIDASGSKKGSFGDYVACICGGMLTMMFGALCYDLKDLTFKDILGVGAVLFRIKG